MRKNYKYYFTILLVPILLLTLSISVSSCDPHRAGSVIKGPSAKNNRHHKPASAKRHRKSKY